MTENLKPLIEYFSGTPILQGILIIFSTFILEDPTTIFTGLLVAEDKIHLTTAFLSLNLGIAGGDLGLYLIGKYFGEKSLNWNWVPKEKINLTKIWLEKNLLETILISRFIPGMRLPTYLSMGIAKVSFFKFSILILLATLIWTTVLLTIVVKIGQHFLPYLIHIKWGFLFLVLSWIGLKFLRKKHAPK